MSNYTRWYRDGTASVNTGSNAVTGLGTYWESAGINPGDLIQFGDGNPFFEILSVNDDTSLTLAGNYTGESVSLGAYSIVRNFTATMPSKVAAQAAELIHDFKRYVDTDMDRITGKSAYEVAQSNGYTGTESEWLASLKGENAYQLAVNGGYTGTQAEWLESLKAAGEWTQLSGQVSTHETHLGTLDAQVSDLESQASTLTTKTTGHDTQFTTVNGQISTLSSQVSTVSTKAASHDTHLGTLDTHVGTLDDSVSDLVGKIGTLGSLTTTQKSNLVAAVNELRSERGGALSGLSTSAKTSVIAAINELVSGHNSLDTRTNPLSYNNAGVHNATYRGKNLGTALTDAQSAAIRAGTFDDVYVGDYWHRTVPAYSWTDADDVVHNEASVTITFRVAGCDYRLKCGDTLTAHHVVVIPDTPLFTARMYPTDTTSGGYVGSEMYTKHLLRAEALVKAAFGESHVLAYRTIFCNSVMDGKPTINPNGHVWVTRYVDLMNEQMVYGGKIFGPSPNTSSDGKSLSCLYTMDKSQLPLFQHRPDLIGNRTSYWLRDVVSGACFACVYASGGAGYAKASDSGGCVRPAFFIY